jgi:two-component sensor histidine kinase
MAAVRRYDILDTPPDGAFDRITAMAARRFDVPISIVSIVDEDRTWFKSHHGLPISQIDRRPGLCASAILSKAAHVVTDASVDPRTLANPLVAGDFGLRFYAGVPLTTSDGYNLGTLCVIDFEARPVEQSQLDDLTDLASIVMDQLELQLSARKAIQQAGLMAREIDHRVMNSLQFVSTLLKMQSKSVVITDVASELKVAAQRIEAVAQVHQHFYSREGTSGACLAFLQRLCSDLSDVLDTPVRVTGEETSVPQDWIQPIGLIINELVTNAAKHGAGIVQVDCRSAGTNIELTVTDDGPGLPKGFEVEAATQGLGMRVVTALVDQLGGRVWASGHDESNGARFSIVLPPPPR